MAATPKIYVYHGVSATTVDITAKNTRYKQADDSNDDLSAPIPRPSSGSSYSYAKHTKIGWTTLPNEQIRNLVWFADEAIGTDPAESWDGMTVWATVVTNYVQATESDATTLRAALAGASDLDDVTASDPLVIVSGAVIGAGDSIGTGPTQDFVLSQMEVLSTVTNGVKGERQVYYQYEEI